ncbi:MAG: CHASE2 domain-containing protein [Candidatus Coatesbacteria bacterium]|nr:CHASE2 domain-containing protein [Candidatus Coatesbacteria bacterium]
MADQTPRRGPRRGRKFLVTLIVCAVAALAAWLLNLTDNLRDFELATMRARVRAKGRSFSGSESPGATVPGISIITIDDYSLLPPEEYGLGRYQDWTREYYAQVLELLEHAEPAAVVFDMHFFEPAGNPDYPRISRTVLEEAGAAAVDEAGVAENADGLERVRRWLELHDEDEVFARALEETGNVALGLAGVDFAHTEQLRELEGHPYVDYALDIPREQHRHLYHYAGFHPPITELTEAVRLLGHTMMHPHDEIIWRVPMIISAAGPRPGETLCFPSLSLAALALAKDVPRDQITFDPDVGVQLGDELTVPTTPQGELLLNYIGPSGQGAESTFNYYSFTDIHYLSQRDDMPWEEKVQQAWDNFHNQVVIIGGTAGSLFDFISSPYSNAHPGVEIHATAIHNMLSGAYLKRLDPLWSLAIFIGLTLAVGFAVAYLRWWLAVPLFLLLFGGYVIAAFHFFAEADLWLEIVRPGTGMLIGMLSVIGFNYVVEQRAKRKIKETFSHYVSPAVVEQMVDNPDMVRLGGEKRELSVIFTDVKGFTTISEQMEPGPLVELMNDYLTPMAELVFANNGTVDKFIGDAVMGIFGAPNPLKHHADAACHTALEMLDKLEELNEGWSDRDLPRLSMRIGVNSGPMVVGNMGSHNRFDYTVMGDNVNLGARLEPLNKFFNTSVIISEFTHRRLIDDFYVRKLGSFRVKGKNEPVICYELLGLGRPAGREAELLERFTAALAHWENAEFKQAFEAFKQLTADFPEDGPSKSYLVQTRSLYANPPGDDWEPIHNMLVK